MKKPGALTIAVIASFSVCILFAIVSIVLTCKGIILSDTLTQYFYITFGIEFAATASIKIVKHRIKTEEHKQGINQDTNDYDEYEGGHFYG